MVYVIGPAAAKNLSTLMLRDTAALKEIASSGAVVSELQVVDGQWWIDHDRAFDFIITERAIRVRDSILVLLC